VENHFGRNFAREILPPAAHPPASIPTKTAAAGSRMSPKLPSNFGIAKPKDKVSTSCAGEFAKNSLQHLPW
jgi:hypothetical protein